MSNKELGQDKELQALHEKYQEESTELPPESIDMSIINAAHSAVSSQHNINNDIASAQLNKINKHAWYVPVSYVAIIVLSLSVFLKLLFESEQLQPELNGVDFSEETFLPDISGQSADKIYLLTDEEKETGGNNQQQLASTEKERLEEMLQQKKKAKAQSKQRSLLKQQVDSSALTETPQTIVVPAKTVQAKPEAVNDSAGVAAEAVAPPMARMTSPPRAKKAEPDSRLYPLQQPRAYSAPASAIAPATTTATTSAIDSESFSGSASKQFMESAEQKSDVRLSDSHQLEQINKLVELFNSRQLDKLKLALALYREDYPYNKEADLLPQAIREQEIIWQIENEAKSLHN